MAVLLNDVVGKAIMGVLWPWLAIGILFSAKEIRMKANSLATILVMAFFALLVSACSGTTTAPAQSSATEPVSINTPASFMADSITAEGHLQPILYADIAFTASGMISQVLVKDGEEVKKGQLLIQLGNASDRNYATAQLELVSAQKALNDLQNTGSEDLAQVVIALKDAREEYDDAVSYLDYLQNSQNLPRTETRRFLVQTRRGYEYRVNTRDVKGPAPEDWIIEAENDLALKKARMEDLQRAYERMKDGVDKDQLAVLEAQLQAAQAGVAAFSVVAPFDGTVADIKAQEGGSIRAGEVVVTIADFSQWLVKTTNLTEFDVVKLSKDQPATVSLDALPDVELKGEILSIGQIYSEHQGDIVYEVTIRLLDTHPAMRWAMTAQINFQQ